MTSLLPVVMLFSFTYAFRNVILLMPCAQLKHASELHLATDEDREGEAIAWHLVQTLKPKVPVKRMVFHEITPEAIRASLEHTRQVDDHMVDAQETRRILDRLYGYELSPVLWRSQLAHIVVRSRVGQRARGGEVLRAGHATAVERGQARVEAGEFAPVLWRKVGPGLSAGRVQSVATRLIVERERERMAFVRAPYWDVVARLERLHEVPCDCLAFAVLISRQIEFARVFERGPQFGEASRATAQGRGLTSATAMFSAVRHTSSARCAHGMSNMTFRNA